MSLPQHILADSDVDLPKIIFGLIFFAIWVLSAIVSWVNKKQQEAKRQAQARERMLVEAAAVRRPSRAAPPRIAEGISHRFPDVLLPPAPPQPPPLPPRVPQQQRRPVPLPPSPPKPVRRTPKAPKQRQAIPLPPPPIEEVTPRPVVPIASATPPPPARKPPSVDAAGIAKWMKPATLRQQFILTEILQPPLAMRPDRELP